MPVKKRHQSMQALLFSKLTRRNLCMHMLIKADEQNLKKKKEMIKLLQQPCSFYYPFSPKRFFH